MRRYFNLLIFAVLLVPAANAAVEVHRFDTPEREATYKVLIAELRCLVCQNQNLADSNAKLAQDLRRQTFEMVESGKSKQEIVDYMVQRYGDFVLYRPPMQSNTLLLWLGPFAFLLLSVVILIGVIRSRGRQQSREFDHQDQQKAEQLLGLKDKQP